MTRCTRVSCGVLLLFTCSFLTAQKNSADAVLAAMQQEVTRSFQNLKQTQVPPYFLSYQLTDNRAIEITAAYGSLTASGDHTTRLLDVDLRLGDYSLDNSHPLREADPYGDFTDRMERQKLPLDDDPDALRVALWLETERKYRSAVQRLQKVKANVLVKVEAEDRCPVHRARQAAREAPRRPCGAACEEVQPAQKTAALQRRPCA